MWRDRIVPEFLNQTFWVQGSDFVNIVFYIRFGCYLELGEDFSHLHTTPRKSRQQNVISKLTAWS
jgi:hypothetical protein